MSKWIWVPFPAVTVFHDRQIARHGGASGMRDIGLLEAACDRPKNLVAYGDPTLAELAAAYAFGIAKAHAFVDGNKRTAFVTALTFLRLNGFGFATDPATGVRMMEDLASDDVSEAAFARWVSDCMSPL